MRQIISFNNKNWPLPRIPEPSYTNLPFGMKVYDGDINVQRRENYYSNCVIYYQIDSYRDNNWSVFPVDSVGINVNSGSIIYFYGPSTNRISTEQSKGKFFISGTGKVDLVGNFLSLCNPNWTENMKITSALNNKNGQFCSLFASQTNIYNAKDMYIRTDEISCGNSNNYGIGFGYMFIGCSNLLTGPTWICKDNKLTIAKMAQFIGMFARCTNLKTITLPPITTYSQTRHFERMLENCSSLQTIYYDGVYPINNTTYSKNFSNEMNATGDFYNLKNATISRDVNGIPLGWTIHTSL